MTFPGGGQCRREGTSASGRSAAVTGSPAPGVAMAAALPRRLPPHARRLHPRQRPGHTHWQGWEQKQLVKRSASRKLTDTRKGHSRGTREALNTATASNASVPPRVLVRMAPLAGSPNGSASRHRLVVRGQQSQALAR